MAFKEVVKSPSQREIANLESNYRAICKKYDSAKYQFIDAVSSEDFEVLPVTAYLELKELYIQKKKLYWKIHELKHPEDTAAVRHHHCDPVGTGTVPLPVHPHLTAHQGHHRLSSGDGQGQL